MTVLATVSAPPSVLPAGSLLASEPSVCVDLQRLVPLGAPTAVVRVSGDGHRDVVAGLDEHPDVVGATVLDEDPDGTLVRIEWTGSAGPFLGTVADVGATPLAGRGDAGAIRFECLFPDEEALATFYELCRSRAADVEIERIDVPGPGSRDGPGGADLSPAQAETLRLALRRGYFSVPRTASIGDLADELGVSEQSVSERIRRGLDALVDATLADDGLAERWR